MATKTGVWNCLGEVEGLDGHFVAFLDGAGNQDDVAAVAVAEQVHLQDVALASPGGKAGAGPHPLDVDDHDRDLGEVGQADELAHERDARPGGRRQRAGAAPAGPDSHADGGQLVLGLDHGERVLAVGLDPVLLEELLGIFGQAARRSDGVPGQHIGAAEQHSQGGRLVPLDQDLVLGRFDRLDAVRQVGGQVLLRPLVRRPRRADVDLGGLGLAAGELAVDGRLDRVDRDAANRGQDADVPHVDDLAELVPISLVGLVRGIGLLHQLLERHREEHDVVAQSFQIHAEIVPVKTDRARLELEHVVLGRRLVHADQDLRVSTMPDVALGTGADVEPRGQALDVRGKHVLAAAWGTHGVEGAKHDQVGGQTARAVDSSNPDRQVIDQGGDW